MADRTRRDDADPAAASSLPAGREPTAMEMARENFGEGVQIEMPMTDQRVREIVAEMLAAQPKAAPAPAPEARTPVVKWKHDADHGETEATVASQRARDEAAGLAYKQPIPDM